ncbi:MAG TPA: response regulator [Myxococcota bacterium]|nr:response regulator [Myxococcota bacterium]
MPKTLLLADDSVTIQKVVGISFANEDIVLLTVDNGDDAIARAREARPDVVLADVVMPGKNGYEVCQAIKSDPALAATPVLLLTGTFEAFDEQRAARAGADGHITKPFEAQSLVDKVNALLARAGVAAAPAPAAAAGTTRVEIGSVRPPRAETPPTPPAPPVSHTADTAYDFFDEEITAPRPGAARAREDQTVLLGGAPAPSVSEGSFDFDDGADAPSESPSPYAPLADAATTTVVHATSAAPPEPEPWSAPAPAPAAAREPDFEPDALGFETSRPAAASEGDEDGLFGEEFPAVDETPARSIGGDTRLLGDSFDAPAGGYDPEATRLGDADAGPIDLDDRAQPGAAASASAPDFARPTAQLEPAGGPAPLDALEELELDAGLESADPFGEAVFDPSGARDYDVSSSDLGQPLAAPPPPEPPPAAWASAWSAQPDPLPEPEPEPARAFAAAPEPERSWADAPEPERSWAPSPEPPHAAPAAAAAAPALGRDELRDMLEKMAWEAFGPLTERLVRDAVDRIERVAWEVIPQLAETLIREEIRKLKGE